jgi:hypothetical protein
VCALVEEAIRQCLEASAITDVEESRVGVVQSHFGCGTMRRQALSAFQPLG